MKRKSRTIVLLLLFLGIMLPANIFAQQITVNYVYSGSDISNPERGWYNAYHNFGSHLTGNYTPLDSSQMRIRRENNHVTLAFRLFYLHQFLNENSVSSDYLALMQKDFDAVRAAGVKCIVRFAYSDSQSAEVWDATPEKVMSHIESLRDVLQLNSDVIAAVQAGFIGAWGEWYYTVNFAGAGYVPDETDQQNRRALVEALLDILPDNVQVQVRTPAIKRNIVQSVDPMLDEQAYDGSYTSRIGPHNDCFLANGTDYGTYVSLSTDLAYLAQETRYTIAGGETCDGSNSYSDCVNAIPRMELLHWTYLNRDYNQTVYTKWQNQGCMEEAGIRMGYRVALTSALLPDSLEAGEVMNLVLNMENRGFAAPTQYKPILVVLENLADGQRFDLPYSGTNDDIRFWFPGTFSTSGTVTLPAELSDGNYRVSLRFPDQYASLSERPVYSIQLANAGTFDAAKGLNHLEHILVVGAGGDEEFALAPVNLLATAFSDSRIDLSWTVMDAEANTEVYRSLAGKEDWELIASLDQGTSIYSDNGLESSTTYTYMVRSVNAYGPSEWTEAISATTLLGIRKGVTNTEPLLYPNPYRNGNLYIGNQENANASVMISDMQGRIWLSGKLDGNILQIAQPGLPSGIYIVKVDSEIKSFSSKLMVY